MFITCQECNTTFRLDEKLLKPTGSKVRCSLCHYTFIATPPAGAPFEAPRVQQAPASEEAPPVRDEEPEAQSLDGIDLAELDSILENESIPALGEDADNHA
ncbi:MAG: hypothetical protein HKP58_04675, partial [Desulfatitalea sp.]|nr:zinc-ribbon domain-containing protein [Desulfatitalea sp.]NNJ99686.1 hypothetical protein [Desulfatitalea sp.]